MDTPTNQTSIYLIAHFGVCASDGTFRETQGSEIQRFEGYDDMRKQAARHSHAVWLSPSVCVDGVHGPDFTQATQYEALTPETWPEWAEYGYETWGEFLASHD